MNKLRYLITIFTFIALAFLLHSCKETPPPQIPPPPVTTIIIKRQDVPAILEYVGVANSSHLVEIRARVEGYLQTIAYKEGELVQENQLLFQIDPKPFEAVLAQAKAVEDQQKAALWEAQRALERFTPLYEQKAASRRDLDNATAQVMGSQASVDAAKAQVLQAEINLGYTTITSPIRAMSNQAKYREGALVGPGSQQSLLTTLYTMDPIWVDFNVSEGDVLKYGTESKKGVFQFPKDMNFDIEVVLSNGSIFPSRGKVDFANPALQQSTGSMNVRAVLPNPEELLRPGQFVRARLLGAIYPNAIIVPQTAVMQGKKGLFVYVINQDSQAEMREVTTGASYKGNFVVFTGLEPGDEVIVDGVNKILPGQTVHVTKPGPN